MNPKKFLKRGYVCIFPNIAHKAVGTFEDWYVHPELVDIEIINNIIEKNKTKYVRSKQGKNNNLVDLCIYYNDIEY